jgi:hypothetical protein
MRKDGFEPTEKAIVNIEIEETGKISMEEIEKKLATDERLIWVDNFVEGFARALTKTNDGVQYFFIDERTKKIAFNEQRFIFANHFKNGKAEITISAGKTGTINKFGKVEISHKKR